MAENPFDFSGHPSPPRPTEPPYGSRVFVDFFSRLTAGFLAFFIAGLLLLIGVRFYVAWEVRRLGDAIGKQMDDFAKELKKTPPLFQNPPK